MAAVAWAFALAIGGLGWWGLARSRTLRRRIESIEQSHAALTGHVEVIERFGSEPFVMFDEHGLIRSLNGRAEKLLGFEAEELYGRSILSLIPNLRREPAREPGRLEIRRKDGARLWLNVRPARVDPERNMYLFFSEPACLSLAAPDLSTVHRVVDRILGQLEEPLTTISGYAELALAAGDAPVREEIEQIAAASDRATRVAQLLVSFAGRQGLCADTVDLNAVLGSMEGELRAAVNADVIVRTGSRPAYARIDPEALRDAVLILCAAAEKRMRDEPRRIEISLEASGVNRILKIADTGEPLSGTAMAHLFEPLYLNREEIGVELSPVWGLVHRLGGEIRLSAGGQHGMTVEILLTH